MPGGTTKFRKVLVLVTFDVNAKTKDGWTALYSASSNGHDKVVQLLLGAGARTEMDERSQ